MWAPQPALLGALADAGAKHPSHELWFGAKVTDLLRDGERVVGCVVQRGEERVEVRSKVVVDADGRFSTLRRPGRFEIAYDRHDFDVLWFTIPEPCDQPAALRAYLTPPRGDLALPRHPNLLQCGMFLPPGGYAWYRDRGIESLRANLLESPEFMRTFARGVTNFAPFTLLQANLDLVADWERDGLVLIGDAAHACSPAGAVGVSIAVETAAVAAEVLIECLAADDCSKARLDTIRSRREPAVREVHRRQIQLARGIGSGSARSRRLVALALPWLAPLGIAQRIVRPLVVGEAIELRA